MSVPPAIFQIAQDGNHLTRSRLPTNRNFVHGGPTGRAAQAHLALGKRKGIEMASSGKKQPRKHFFNIPTNFYELSDEEQSAWTLKIAKVLHREMVEGLVERW
ncbi:MAG: hypothetical protein Q8K48_09215 [Candidatus Planktophila sp.]|nr:hypothetical protein [Candidatus Planktophila sp.]